MKIRLLAGMLVMTGCSGALPNVSMESLGRMGASAVPIGPETEQEFGRGIAAVVAGRFRVLEDPEITRYVNLVGSAVAEQSVRRGEVEFRFGVLDTPEINAFAAPGGYIFITRGALAQMQNEAELAGVLAHEIAHVDQQHVVKEIRRSSLMQTARDEAELRGPLLDRITEFGSSILFTGLSREDELAADSFAIVYAAAVGYQADGLPRFLTRLADADGEEPQNRLRELRATHPPIADRLTALREHLMNSQSDPAQGQALEQRFRLYVPAAH